MRDTLQRNKLETLIAQDSKLIFTLLSYALILITYINLKTVQSPIIGLAASTIYFLINAIFLGNALFGKETSFFRLIWGILSLIMLLGFVGWLAIIIYNLDSLNLTIVLFITATLSSLLNKR